MGNFTNWLEARELRMGTYPDEIEPIKSDDEFVVYHGFYNFWDAVNIAIHGTSGAMPTKRVYSYESENNPRGMFVTLDRETAMKNFAGGWNRIVMEFVARQNELQPPTWPGGSYTVQGEMAPYFYQDPRGARVARAAKKKSDEEEARKSRYAALSQSVRPGLARTLFGSEMQALFVGHLNPERITRFWLCLPAHPDGKPRIDDPWSPVSREELVERYQEEFFRNPEHKPGRWDNKRGIWDTVSDTHSRFRVFKPEDEFDWQKLAAWCNQQHNMGLQTEDDLYKDFVGALCHRSVKDVLGSHRFETVFGNYLWPRQLPKFYLWVKKMYRKLGEPR